MEPLSLLSGPKEQHTSLDRLAPPGCSTHALPAAFRSKVYPLKETIDLLDHISLYIIKLFKCTVFEGACPGACVLAKLLQSGPTLCDPMDYSLPGSSVHGILQARILKWVAILFSRGSSRPRDRACGCYVSCIGRWVLYR